MELFDESGCPVKLIAGGPSATGAAAGAAAGSGAGAAARGGSVGAGPETGGAGEGFGGLRTEALEEEEDDGDGYEVGRSTPAATSSSRVLRFLAPGLPCPALLAAMRASSGGGAVSGKFTCDKVIVKRKT